MIWTPYIWCFSLCCRNTRWTLIKTQASLRCSWRLWTKKTRERSLSNFRTAKPPISPVWCWSETVRIYIHVHVHVCDVWVYTDDDIVLISVFKQLQKESEFQRKEWHRKQGKNILCVFIYCIQYCICPM